MKISILCPKCIYTQQSLRVELAGKHPSERRCRFHQFLVTLDLSAGRSDGPFIGDHLEFLESLHDSLVHLQIFVHTPR